MRRGDSVNPKVTGRLHQTSSKVPLPDSIDDDAGRQRIVGRRDPLSKLNPSLLIDSQFSVRRCFEMAVSGLRLQQIRIGRDAGKHGWHGCPNLPNLLLGVPAS